MIRDFQEINLASRNSFHVEQRARRLIEFETEEELMALFRRERFARWMVLSGGNNVLFTQDYDGVILTPVSQRIDRCEAKDGAVRVRVGAGVEWDDLVAWAVERGLWGLENLSLIPGKVGAAPVQNIGAYGAEAKDVIREVRFYDVESDAMRTLKREECRFGYRESIFKQELKGRVVITEVEIELSREAYPRLGYGDVEREVERLGGATLRNIREAICSIRRSKLPDTAVLGNAGSFFKNPVVERAVAEKLLNDYPEMPHYPTAEAGKVKLAAGWLIDRAGLKGYREGRVGVHEKQALVLVNYGGADGAAVIALAHKVQQEVKKQFGIAIDTEVNIL